MIIRVNRARVREGARDGVRELMRQGARRAGGRVEGLSFLHIGERVDADGRTQMVGLSAWETFDRLVDVMGANWRSATAIPGAADLVEGVQLDHYEALVWRERDAPDAGEHPRFIRIYSARINPGAEEEAFAIVRRAARDLDPLPRGLVAYQVGRRLDEREQGFVSITVWSDEDAARAVLGADLTQPSDALGLQRYMHAASLETYEAIVTSLDELREAS